MKSPTIAILWLSTLLAGACARSEPADDPTIGEHFDAGGMPLAVDDANSGKDEFGCEESDCNQQQP